MIDTIRKKGGEFLAFGPLLWLVACLACLGQTGCMSPITSLAIREALDASLATMTDSGAVENGRRNRHATAAKNAERTVADEDDEASAADVASAAEPSRKPLSLEEAVDRAVARLAHFGPLDAATQSTLLSMLESTKPEDWPAAIDAFAAALEANRQTAAKRPEAPQPEADPLLLPDPASEPLPAEKIVAAKPTVVEPMTLEPMTLEPVDPAPALVAAVAPIEPAVIEPAVVTPVAAAQRLMVVPAVIAPLAGDPADDEPAMIPAPSPPPPLAVGNACFVSRVRAWGVVDRFEEQVFRPGQEVIVYFELDALSSREGLDGHSTSIDTRFRLVGADGRQVGQWNFEPIEETCHAPRRDYFARYFLRIPDNASPGLCRLDFVVTDRLAGVSTQAHLDLEVRP
jgi:hypothetical protein